MKYIAYMTKGLEQVSEEELLVRVRAMILHKGDKRIVFESDADIDLLMGLRTIDDLGFYIGSMEGVTNCAQILEYISTLDLNVAKTYLEGYRKVDDTFSLTVSAARSSLNTRELIPEVASRVKEVYKLSFVELSHDNFDFKIFIDRKDVLFSVRLTQISLHNRLYKKYSLPGSLKPTVAAAMVQLATKFSSGNIIVDNFCGSGTILCECLLADNIVYGGDINLESVIIAKKNLENISEKNIEIITTLDAMKSGWRSSFFDIAISNMPWDKQIKVESITDLYEGTIREYSRILKVDGVLCALVGKPELFIKYAKKYLPEKTIQQIKIGLLGQNPTIVLVK